MKGMFLKSKINIDLFLNIKRSEVAYLLGYFWADGHIRPVMSKDGERVISSVCTMEILNRDFQRIKKCFRLTGNWNYLIKQKRKNSENLFSRAYSGDREIYNFLLENDYRVKSYVSPDKILSKIPIKLHKYFFRGWFDGDGSIHCCDKNKTISVASTYDQDWSALEGLCKSLGVQYRIYKRKNKAKNGHTHKASIFIISNTYNILRFGNYLYKGFNKNNIGLYRKYKVFKKVKRLSLKMKNIKQTLRDKNGNVMLENFIGRKFNMLTVLKEGKRGNSNERRLICKCDCGKIKDFNKNDLVHLHIKNCGCIGGRSPKTKRIVAEAARKRMTIHGESKTEFYQCWYRMNYRHHKSLLNKRWLNYLKFKKDMFSTYQRVKNSHKCSIIAFCRKNQAIQFSIENCFWNVLRRRRKYRRT